MTGSGGEDVRSGGREQRQESGSIYGSAHHRLWPGPGVCEEETEDERKGRFTPSAGRLERP